MNIAITISKKGIPIRLTNERWKHICLMHPSLKSKQKNVLSTIKSPDYILKGSKRELLAISGVSKGGYIVVVYKESTADGFIITAFETTDKLWLFKKEVLWSKPS